LLLVAAPIAIPGAGTSSHDGGALKPPLRLMGEAGLKACSHEPYRMPSDTAHLAPGIATPATSW
jgi:hypothetical protein